MLNQSYGVGLSMASWLQANGPLLFLIIIWSIFWKGLALWHAGRRGQPWWFVIMLIVNTLGILEIIYLFGVAKLKWSELFSKK
jgi:methionyl-tRNA synthetase